MNPMQNFSLEWESRYNRFNALSKFKISPQIVELVEIILYHFKLCIRLHFTP